MILGISEVAHIYNNHVVIYLPFAYSIESNNNHIHQTKSTDVVITMLVP